MPQSENSSFAVNIWKIFIVLSVIFTATSIFLWFGSFGPKSSESDLMLENSQKTVLWNQFLYVHKNPIELVNNDPYQHFKISDSGCPEDLSSNKEYPFTKQKEIIESNLKMIQDMKKDEEAISSNEIKSSFSSFKNSFNEYLVYQKSTIDIYEKIDTSAYKIQTMVKNVCSEKTISSENLDSLKNQITQAKDIYGINSSWIENVSSWAVDLENKYSQAKESQPNLDALFSGKKYLDIFETSLSKLETYDKDSLKLANSVVENLDKLQADELALSKDSRTSIKLVMIVKPKDYLS